MKYNVENLKEEINRILESYGFKTKEIDYYDWANIDLDTGVVTAVQFNYHFHKWSMEYTWNDETTSYYQFRIIQW